MTKDERWWRASMGNNRIEHVTVVSETAHYVTVTTSYGTRRAKKQSQWEYYARTREEVIAWKRGLLEQWLEDTYKQYQAAQQAVAEFDAVLEKTKERALENE